MRWGEESAVLKIEAGSEGAESAPSLEPGDTGTPCPGSGVVTHSWELGWSPGGACQLLWDTS